MAADGSDGPDPVFAFLLEKVKSLIWSDPSAKVQWQTWCDRHMGGQRDGSRMDVGSLEFFFVEYERGTILPGPPPEVAHPAPARPPPATPVPPPPPPGSTAAGQLPAVPPPPAASPQPPPGPEQAELAQAVKIGQRTSPSWKVAWVTYCQRHGHVKFDPAKHSSEFLQAFLDLAGSQGQSALHAVQAAAAAGNSPLAGQPGLGPPQMLAPPHLGGLPPAGAVPLPGAQVLPGLPPPQWPCTAALPAGGALAMPQASLAQPGVLPQQAMLAPQAPQVALPVGQPLQAAFLPQGALAPQAPPQLQPVDPEVLVLAEQAPPQLQPVDPEVLVLAEQVIELQKADPSKMQQWSEFCSAHAGGVTDTLRHRPETLQAFLQECGVL